MHFSWLWAIRLCLSKGWHKKKTEEWESMHSDFRYLNQFYQWLMINSLAYLSLSSSDWNVCDTVTAKPPAATLNPHWNVSRRNLKWFTWFKKSDCFWAFTTTEHMYNNHGFVIFMYVCLYLGLCFLTCKLQNCKYSIIRFSCIHLDCECRERESFATEYFIAAVLSAIFLFPIVWNYGIWNGGCHMVHLWDSSLWMQGCKFTG